MAQAKCQHKTIISKVLKLLLWVTILQSANNLHTFDKVYLKLVQLETLTLNTAH